MTSTALRRAILDLDPCFYAPLDGHAAGGDRDLASRTALTVVNSSFAEARSVDGGRARGIYGETNYLTGGTNEQLDRPSESDEITMLCFARYPAGSTPSGQNNIFQRPWTTHSSPYYEYGIFAYGAGAFSRAAVSGGFDNIVGSIPFATGESWASGRWHFFAFQFSARLRAARGFLNAKEVENSSYSAGHYLAAADRQMYIGRLANAGESFGGYIAHVAVFPAFLARRDLRRIESLGQKKLSSIDTFRASDRLLVRAR